MTKPSAFATIVLLISIASAYIGLEVGISTEINAGMAAKRVGIGILIFLFIEFNNSRLNLIKSDIIAIIGIYGLILFEFLFEQDFLNNKISSNQAYLGLELTLTGLFFLVIGRHLYSNKKKRRNELPQPETNINVLLNLYYLSWFLAFFYMLLNVNFNPLLMIEKAMGPRFSQPWARGRLGGAFVFLSELQLFSYVVPPLAGILFNNRNKLSGIKLMIILILLFITLFMGFLGGTRNVFFVYLIGFMGGFVLTSKELTVKKMIFPAVIVLFLAYLGGTYMVQFRSIGLERYMNGVRSENVEENQVYVDHNLYTLGLLKESFPSQHDYLGSEVFMWALAKPVPRVLWPGKPEGLSISMEEVAGIEGYTLASTYIGETYMAGGTIAVIIVSLILGYLCSWWNQRARIEANLNSRLIYALGLFTISITMRSIFMFTTAILPIIGVYVLMKYLRK